MLDKTLGHARGQISEMTSTIPESRFPENNKLASGKKYYCPFNGRVRVVC